MLVFADVDLHQTRILEALARGDKLLRAAKPDSAALAQVRWTLAGTIRAYQIHKHQRIFDPAIASGPPRAAGIARELKARCLAATAAGRAFILEWSGRSEGEHWHAYAAATLRMNAMIRAQLYAERLGLGDLERALSPERRSAG